MFIPVLGIVPNLYEPQIGCRVDRTHQLLAGISKKVFLNQWGLPDIHISLDDLLKYFKPDFLCLNSDSLEKNLLTIWIYQTMNTFLIFKQTRLIFHFKWSKFKQEFKKPEIMI
jgi:hypothetical protein